MEVKKLKIERVVLDSDSISSIEPIIHTLHKKFGDQLNVNQKLVANFILKHRCQPLSDKEMEILNQENQDFVRVLNRALQTVKRAKQSGNELQLNEVLNLIKTPGVNAEVSSQRVTKKMRKSEAQPRTKKTDSFDIAHPESNSEGSSAMTSLEQDHSGIDKKRKPSNPESD